MEIVCLNIVFLIGLVRTSLGATTGLPVLTCDNVHPTLTSTVVCSCQNYGSLGIIWNTNGAYLTECTILNELCFNSPGYTFTVNSSTSTYTIEFGSYNYTDCRDISCIDSTSPSKSDLKHISLDETSLIPTTLVVNEPSTSHTNGNISFTTDCIYKANSTSNSFTSVWTAIYDKGEDKNLDIDATIYKFGSCQSCNQDFASKFFIGFYHEEDTSEHKMEAKIRLQLIFDGYTLNSTTNQKYFVKVRSGVTSKTWCYFSHDESYCIRIIAPVVGTVVVVVVVIVVVIIWKVKQGSAQGFSVVNVEKTSIEVRWNRYDRNSSSDKIYYLKISNNNNPIPIADSGKTSFSYTFSNLQNSTVYNIELNCSDNADQNNVFKRYKPLKVRTKGVPEAPSEFRVDGNDITESSIRVRWEPGDDGGNRQTFVLTCSTKDRIIEIEHNGEKDMSYQWRNLSEGTYYDLGLRAKSIEGLCTRIQPLKKRTLGKPDPPTKLRALNVTEKDMEVKWKAGSNGGYIQSFKLVVLNNGSKMFEEHDYHDTNGKSDNHLKLKNLSPSTDYVLILSSTNAKGVVQCIEPLHVRTKGKPGQPNLRFENNDITATSITVRWDPGSDEGYKQTFVVTISGKGISPTCNEIQDSGSNASWLKRWTQLLKATDYDISIYAKNKIGRSETLTRSVKTLATKPDPPKFEEGDVTENSITVKWEPGHDGGCEQTFYVYLNGNEYKAEKNGAYTFGQLPQKTYYDIALKAKNKEGEVSASPPSLHIRTHGRPDTPKDFEIVDRTNSTLTMKWEPGNDGGFSQHFILMDVKSGEKLTDPIQDTADHIMQHTITNLKDGTEFKLQVQASNEKGTSSSKTEKVKTRKLRTADK